MNFLQLMHFVVTGLAEVLLAVDAVDVDRVKHFGRLTCPDQAGLWLGRCFNAYLLLADLALQGIHFHYFI